MPENRSYNITVNGGNPKDYKLSQTDFKILKAIANNSREKLVNIAAKCKLKPSAVKYRLKQLEKMDVINAYRIGVNQKLLEKEFCKAFLYLHQKTTEKENALMDFCKTHPNVTAYIRCIGSWDFEIEFEVDNMDSFHNIMKEIRNRFDFVKSYESYKISVSVDGGNLTVLENNYLTTSYNNKLSNLAPETAEAFCFIIDNISKKIK